MKMDIKVRQNDDVLPFGLIYREPETIDRGYDIYPEAWNYDPKTQITDLILMGRSNPTTYSRISSSFLMDLDEGSDDKGTD
jgi:hypothetical protein